MPERFLNIGVQLTTDESPLEAGMENWSGFLTVAHRLNLGSVIGNAEAGLYANSKQQELWADLKTKNGGYIFELATELPFYLPTMGRKHEYLINLGMAELFVSLRMVRALVGKGVPHEDGLKYVLVHRLGLRSLIEQGKHEDLHPLPIKTFISRKFTCQSASAQEAIQSNFLVWRGELISQIEHLIDAMRATNPEAAKFLGPQPSLAFYPIFWLRATGADEKSRCAQFLGGFEFGTFTPQSDIKAEDSERLKNFLKTPEAISSGDHALALARTFCNFGHYELSIVELCVACEITLSQKYWLFLEKRGVSKSKFEDNKNEITFSQLLNVHLFGIRDLSTLANSENILGTINWARKIRNDVVHKGKLKKRLNAKRVTEAIDAAEKLLAFLQ
jgi:hypothetical protein